jgi:hypothetical protein
MSDPRPTADPTCDEVREMAGAFVLGALGPAEDAAVRAHLATCEESHDEMAELGGVLPALIESVPVVEPPAGLKAQIMAAAAADLAARGAPAAAAVTAAVSTPAAARTPGHAPGPTTPRRPATVPTPFPTAQDRAARRSRPSVATWILGIAAVLAIVALGGWNYGLQAKISADTRYQMQVDAVLTIAALPGSRSAIIVPTGDEGAGLAAISATGTVTAVMQDLAPTTGSSVYEAWAIGGDGKPLPIGSFTVGSDGIAAFEVPGAPTEDGVVLALTHEPGPGAKTPTLPIIAKGVTTAAS